MNLEVHDDFLTRPTHCQALLRCFASIVSNSYGNLEVSWYYFHFEFQEAEALRTHAVDRTVLTPSPTLNN